MKQFRVLCFLFVTVALLVSLSGCKVGLQYPDVRNRQTAYVSISLGVPDSDQEVESKLIEEDSYGRQWIWIEGESIYSLMPPKQSFYVIQQKSDRQGVYYYEDIAWCFDDTEGDALEQWKLMNDWNLPLCEEKMSYRHCCTVLHGYVDIEEAKSIDYLESKNDIEQWAKSSGKKLIKDSPGYWGVDGDGNGKELWIVRMKSADGNIEDLYIILTKGEGVSKKALSVSDALTDRAKFTQFKYENGWNYPDKMREMLLQIYGYAAE